MSRRSVLFVVTALVATRRLHADAWWPPTPELAAADALKEYTSDAARLDYAYARFAGLRAFFQAVYDAKYLALGAFSNANAEWNALFSRIQKDKVTTQSGWDALAAQIETNASTSQQVREAVEGCFFTLLDSEEATVAFMHAAPGLAPKGYRADLYGKPPKGVTEEQMTAARLFGRTLIDKPANEPRYRQAAVALPRRYVMPLYLDLARDYPCHPKENEPALKALVAGQRATIMEYFEGVLHWPQSKSDKELRRPGTYNASKFPKGCLIVAY